MIVTDTSLMTPASRSFCEAEEALADARRIFNRVRDNYKQALYDDDEVEAARLWKELLKLNQEVERLENARTKADLALKASWRAAPSGETAA